jgi:TetR/AcrR family transcriptional repressor of bet genes
MKKTQDGSNSVIQNERRRLLIDATISAISEHGLSKVTLAKIAQIAGLTAGSVNFHFDSKELLLLEALSYLTRELDQSIDRAIDNAGADPAAQLLAVFEASLDPEITEPRKTAVWYAYASEARTRADYQNICGTHERKTFGLILVMCDHIINRGKKKGKMDPRAMANAIQGLIDEIWEEILYAGDDYDREDARLIYLSFLASVFPWSYTLPERGPADSSSDNSRAVEVKVRQADSSDIKLLGKLFDMYRQFYDQPGDLKRAKKFIGDNLKKERSVIFLATDQQDQPLGFTQLYPGWCSVATEPFWTLYDLYVDEAARQLGVGRALMAAAEKHARKTRACRIDLETAFDNYRAQSLYEELGYARETEFYKYSLELS